MIAVECRAWADNIEHDRMDRRGLAHFEVRELECVTNLSTYSNFQLMID